MDNLVKLKVVWEVSRNESHSFFSANSNVHIEVAQGKETVWAPRLHEDGLSAAILGSVMDTLPCFKALCLLSQSMFCFTDLFKGDLQLLVFDIFPFANLYYLSLNSCVPCFTNIQIVISI